MTIKVRRVAWLLFGQATLESSVRTSFKKTKGLDLEVNSKGLVLLIAGFSIALKFYHKKGLFSKKKPCRFLSLQKKPCRVSFSLAIHFCFVEAS